MDGFAGRLKIIMKEHSVNKFAKKCGFSESVIRSYLKGGVPGLDKATRIAKIADVDISWLATGEGSPDKGGVDVSAYSGDVIDKHVVAQSVEAVKQYLDKTKEDMNPDAFANAVLAVCDLAPKYGDIDLQLIENIMKLKNSL